MFGNGKVFISHTNDAHSQCDAIYEFLTDKGVNCWYDARNMAPGQVLTQEMQRAIEERDIFLRVCTLEANTSFFMQLERDILVALQSVEYRTERRRLSISLCFPGYHTEPFDLVAKYIDASDPELPQAAWLDELRRALDLPMGWVVFDRDDRDYLWWIHTYRLGWVVNAERRPRASNLKLHHATCANIGDGYLPGALVGRDFIKVCGLELNELQSWAISRLGPDTQFSPCGNCMYKEMNTTTA